MKLRIISPTGTVLDRDVKSVTVPGGMGQFTILRDHAPIVSTLLAGKVVYDSGEMDIAGGMIRAADNVINIYL